MAVTAYLLYLFRVGEGWENDHFLLNKEKGGFFSLLFISNFPSN